MHNQNNLDSLEFMRRDHSISDGLHLKDDESVHI